MLSRMCDFGLALQNAVVMPVSTLNDNRSSQALVWTFFVTSDLRYMISEEHLSACSDQKVALLERSVSPVGIHIRKMYLSSSSIADQKNGPTVLAPSIPL